MFTLVIIELDFLQNSTSGHRQLFESSHLDFPQLLSHQERVAEMQEKQVNLKKDLAEMQEWMAQVDDEFLMRDFEYKGPEELEASLEEMKVRRFFTVEFQGQSMIPDRICWKVQLLDSSEFPPMIL